MASLRRLPHGCSRLLPLPATTSIKRSTKPRYRDNNAKTSHSGQALIESVMSDHFTNLGAYYACPSQAIIDSKSGLTGSLKQLIDPFTEYEYSGNYDDYMADW